MKKNKNSKNIGLGSGLSSLLGNEFETKAIFTDNNNDKFKMVPVEYIEPGPWQPRKIFDQHRIGQMIRRIDARQLLRDDLGALFDR